MDRQSGTTAAPELELFAETFAGLLKIVTGTVALASVPPADSSPAAADRETTTRTAAASKIWFLFMTSPYSL
jgi:hypothetical protein